MTFILAVAFVAVTLAWLGLWDDIAEAIPQLSVHMNMGCYLVFSSVLFIMWFRVTVVFDRFQRWRVRPGQMVEQHIIAVKPDDV
ncbi:MAG: hypothetical protein AAGJ70_09545 [Pseudomonadota bacterium]